MAKSDTSIIDAPELREKVGVFRDRAHAGALLSQMLSAYGGSDALVVAIPAGGVPVGSVLGRRLDLPLDVAVVSKITPPWDTEIGYGAVGFDATVQLNEHLVARLGLSDAQIQEGIEKTLAKVQRRIRTLRGDRPFPALSGRSIIVVDDGLASGLTMQVAVRSLAREGAKRILVAVPTGHQHAVQTLAGEVDAVYCANVRSGHRFAVADAYHHWSDIKERDLSQWLEQPRT